MTAFMVCINVAILSFCAGFDDGCEQALYECAMDEGSFARCVTIEYGVKQVPLCEHLLYKEKI